MATSTSGYTERIEMLEDEIARFITTSEQMDKLRQLMVTLRKRERITEAYYQDLRDTLTYIDGTLLIGKANTVALRHLGRGKM